MKILLSVSGFNDLDHRYHLLADTKLEKKILLSRCSMACAEYNTEILLAVSGQDIIHLLSGSVAEDVVNMPNTQCGR